MKASILVLALFCSFLLAALALDISLLWALAAGYGLFFVHALKEGVPARRLVSVSLSGMRTVSPILAVFVIIGMLTASWRASGTIACLVSMSLGVMEPESGQGCATVIVQTAGEDVVEVMNASTGQHYRIPVPSAGLHCIPLRD